MSFNLQKGQKIKLNNLTNANSLSIEISAQDNHGLIYDMSCFGLDNAGKCSDDRYFIFYNQRESPERSILLSQKITENKELFKVYLDGIPSKINKVVFVLTIDGDDNMSKLANGVLTILANHVQVASFCFRGNDFNSEKAVMVGELYLLNNEWRFGAIGQGFNGGLSALLKYFGIDEVTDSAQIQVPPSLEQQPSSITNRFAAFAKELFSAPISYLERQRAEVAAKQEAKRQAEAQSELARRQLQAELESFNRKQEAFKQELIAALADGVLTQQEMQQLEMFCNHNGLSLSSCLAEYQSLINAFLMRVLVDICSDNIISDEEEKSINAACHFLNPSQQIKNEIKVRIDRVKHIQEIKSGRITHIVGLPIITKMDEMIWHHRQQAELMRELQNKVNLHNGEIYITSQRVIFESREHPVEVALSNIIKIDSNLSTLFISGKSKKTTCQFRVKDADILEAYLEQAIAKFHRKLNIKQTSGNTRKISQEVKQKVWLRDGGQCVQCNATDYLEFDHVIPFSKGGSNSENNIQLLCRRCNLAKSDRL